MRHDLACGGRFCERELRSRNLTELAKYTTDLLFSLEKETGQSTGFKQNGSISVAPTERMEELKRGASMASNFGWRSM